MIVRMLVPIGGSWPPVGGTVELDATKAGYLVAAGKAEPVDDEADQAAAAKKAAAAEKRAARTSTKKASTDD